MELYFYYFLIFVVLFLFYFTHFGLCPSLTASNLEHFCYFSGFLIFFTILFFLVFFIIYDKGNLESKTSLLYNYFYKLFFFIFFCLFFSIIFNNFIVIGKNYVYDSKKNTYTWFDLIKIIIYLFISTFYDEEGSNFCFIFYSYDFFFF